MLLAPCLITTATARTLPLRHASPRRLFRRLYALIYGLLLLIFSSIFFAQLMLLPLLLMMLLLLPFADTACRRQLRGSPACRPASLLMIDIATDCRDFRCRRFDTPPLFFFRYDDAGAARRFHAIIFCYAAAEERRLMLLPSVGCRQRRRYLLRCFRR